MEVILLCFLFSFVIDFRIQLEQLMGIKVKLLLSQLFIGTPQISVNLKYEISECMCHISRAAWQSRHILHNFVRSQSTMAIFPAPCHLALRAQVAREF